MEYNFFILLSLLLSFFSFCQGQKLDLTKYKTPDYSFSSKSWKDLLNVGVQCPNRGVLKNFVLRRNNYKFWYEYSCYSSIVNETDYGEPIIKRLTGTSDANYGSVNIQSSIKTLNGFVLECFVDYGLNTFGMYEEKNYYSSELKRATKCHGLKTTYTSTLIVTTEPKSCAYNSFDALFDVVVGRTDEEDDVNIGYPLRGFKYVVDSSNYNYATVYYVYSYSILRNMKVVKDEYIKKFEALRKSNTQAN